MKKSALKIFSLLLCITMPFGCSERSWNGTAEYLGSVLERPSTGGLGGDWSVFALARSDSLPQGWETGYKEALEVLLRENNGLTGRKNTDCARAVLALRALGEDPSDFRGYDLTKPLHDLEKTAAQGPAAIALAILALDGLESGKLKAAYFEKLLAYQLPEGGFAPSGGQAADPDLTAMALQALAHCSGLDGASRVRESALAVLSALQQPDGGYLNGGVSNPETVSQVIIALLECGLDLDDPSFVKDRGLLEALADFRLEDGGYAHTLGGPVNLMATEQAMCALAAINRREAALSPLYVFTYGDSSSLCSLTVSCAALLEEPSALEGGLVPDDGILYSREIEFSPGESAFDLLKRAMRDAGIPMEFTSSPGGGAYIEGIANIYEFDFGDMSGWTYSVNGEYPQLSCALWEVGAGDRIVFEYATEYVDVKGAA